MIQFLFNHLSISFFAPKSVDSAQTFFLHSPEFWNHTQTSSHKEEDGHHRISHHEQSLTKITQTKTETEGVTCLIIIKVSTNLLVDRFQEYNCAKSGWLPSFIEQDPHKDKCLIDRQERK